MLRNVENVDARLERTRQHFSEEFDSCLKRWRREEGRVSFLSVKRVESRKAVTPNHCTLKVT